MNNYLVSTIIPAYNASEHIKETIESVLNQTWKNVEIIVIDDGSSDNTVEVVKSINSDKIILHSQINQGASAAKQTGLSFIKGDFVQYLDADDLLDPKKFEVQLNALFQNPDHVAICKTVHFFNGNNYLTDNIPDDDTFFENYLDDPVRFLIKLYGGFDDRGGMIQPNAILAPVHIIKNAGPWNTSFSPCPDEDGEYFCRVILNSKGVCYQPEIYNYYRKFKNKTSLSGLKTDLSILNLAKSAIAKHTSLLRFNKEKELVPYINSYLFRDLFQLQVKSYPFHKKAYRFINDQLKSLPRQKQPDISLGGGLINSVANVNWKLARLLQEVKTKFNS